MYVQCPALSESEAEWRVWPLGALRTRLDSAAAVLRLIWVHYRPKEDTGWWSLNCHARPQISPFLSLGNFKDGSELRTYKSIPDPICCTGKSLCLSAVWDTQVTTLILHNYIVIVVEFGFGHGLVDKKVSDWRCAVYFYEKNARCYLRCDEAIGHLFWVRLCGFICYFPSEARQELTN